MPDLKMQPFDLGLKGQGPVTFFWYATLCLVLMHTPVYVPNIMEVDL